MLKKFFLSRTFFLKVLPALGLHAALMYGICHLAFWTRFAVLLLLPLVVLGGLAFVMYSYVKKNPMFANMMGMVGKVATPKPTNEPAEAAIPDMSRADFKKFIKQQIDLLQKEYDNFEV